MARPDLMTSQDLADLCSCDVKTVHNWFKKGWIPGFKTPGRQLRFEPQNVLSFLEKHGYAVPPELRERVQRGTGEQVAAGGA